MLPIMLTTFDRSSSHRQVLLPRTCFNAQPSMLFASCRLRPCKRRSRVITGTTLLRLVDVTAGVWLLDLYTIRGKCDVSPSKVYYIGCSMLHAYKCLRSSSWKALVTESAPHGLLQSSPRHRLSGALFVHHASKKAPLVFSYELPRVEKNRL